ncbi:hypothetical protein CH253_08225 [Rhodococcus sp. 06-156-3C]|nr:hypothetical protein CH253_08225 [Rhodococcus sp. 06-156-3C]
MAVCKGPCSMGEWLDDDDREALKVFLAQGDSMAALHKFFQAEAEMPVGLTAFKDHVRNRCGCEK